MASFQKINHKGKQIYILDAVGSTPEQAIDLLGKAQKEIIGLPPKSALILTDVTNTVYSKDSAEALRSFAAQNTPFVKASAAVGADGLRSVLLQAVALFTKRDIKGFKNREDALDWLVSRV